MDQTHHQLRRAHHTFRKNKPKPTDAAALLESSAAHYLHHMQSTPNTTKAHISRNDQGPIQGTNAKSSTAST
eukprot:5658168-Amphidinium_carterae.3